MSEKIKPCPFCGNEEPAITNELHVQIECYDCGAKTPEYHSSDYRLSDVVDDWNWRYGESKMVDEIAELREMLKRHKEFNEHMHEMPPEWTLLQSMELHKETTELLNK